VCSNIFVALMNRRGMFYKNVAITQDGFTLLQNYKCHSNEYRINDIKCLIAEIDTIE
jgi:hypothetical protein